MAKTIAIPPFTIDLASQVIHRGGREIRVRRKTFALLRYLLENRDRLLTKEEILDRVWPDTYVGDAVLKVTLSQLRKIFRECQGLEIATAHGRGYRVHLDETPLGEGGRADAVRSGTGPGHLIGRGRELASIRESLVKAETGERQIIFIGGEPGIGKSALVDAFVAGIADLGGAAAHAWIGQGRCRPVPGTAEPFRPVFAALTNIQPRQAIECLSPLLSRFAPHLLDEVESLGAEPPSAAPESLDDALAAELEELSSARLLVLALDDLQWADVQTCSLLTSLFQRRKPSRLLVLATYRTGDLASRHHPLASVLQELCMAHPKSAHVLKLEALGRTEVGELVESRLGGAPGCLAGFLFDRSRGNPLFLDRLLAHLQACGALRRDGEEWRFDPDRAGQSSVPGDLEHFIAAQLEEVGRDCRRVLQSAAVAGMTFMAQDIAAVLGLTVEQVESVCDDLANRHHLLEMSGVKSRGDGVVGTEYSFRHPLFQNVLYERLPPLCRQDFHARLAAQLEASYGESAVLNAHELAHHFERGGVPDRTLYYLRVAAHVAVRRGMLGNGREYLREVTRILEATPASSGRLDAASELARLLIIFSGPTAETSAAVGRALALQEAMPHPHPDSPAGVLPTFLVFVMHVVEGDFRKAHEVARKLCELRPNAGAPEVQTAVGVALYGVHQPAAAIAELQRALDGRNPEYGLVVDHTVIAHAILALSFLQIGEFTRARENYDVALQRARASEAPLNHTIGLGFLTELHLLCGEWEWASRFATDTIAISSKHDFRTFVGQARFVKGLAAFESGRYEEGLSQMASGLESCKTTAHGLGLPYLLALYGHAQAAAGRLQAGLQSVEGALSWTERSGESRAEPEIRRLKAAVLRGFRKRREQAAAVSELSAAVESARSHGSHLFHLRAALDLARALRHKDRSAARAALRQALDEIDPGVEARELRASRDLLQRLGS